jgi:hypothetical protein
MWTFYLIMKSQIFLQAFLWPFEDPPSLQQSEVRGPEHACMQIEFLNHLSEAKHFAGARLLYLTLRLRQSERQLRLTIPE